MSALNLAVLTRCDVVFFGAFESFEFFCFRKARVDWLTAEDPFDRCAGWRVMQSIGHSTMISSSQWQKEGAQGCWKVEKKQKILFQRVGDLDVEIA